MIWIILLVGLGWVLNTGWRKYKARKVAKEQRLVEIERQLKLR